MMEPTAATTDVTIVVRHKKKIVPGSPRAQQRCPDP
jgi:hypothetical protein